MLLNKNSGDKQAAARWVLIPVYLALFRAILDTLALMLLWQLCPARSPFCTGTAPALPALTGARFNRNLYPCITLKLN